MTPEERARHLADVAGLEPDETFEKFVLAHLTASRAEGYAAGLERAAKRVEAAQGQEPLDVIAAAIRALPSGEER